MIRALLLAVLSAVAASAPPLFAQAPPPSADLPTVKAWLTGEFDNFQQAFEAKEAQVQQPHQRVHTVISPIATPDLGPHVLLARESALNDPERIQTVHLYALTTDGGGLVTLRLYNVSDPALRASLSAGQAPAADIRANQVTVLDGCDVTWRREGPAFTGNMKPGSCRTTWPKTGQAVTVTNTYRLTADELWFAERLTDEAGALLFGRADGVPFKLKRARTFSCYAAMLKEGTSDKYDGMLNVMMHDQGKWVTFRTEDGRETKYAFELSQLRYSQKVPVMKLALYEAGKDQAFAYTWADPGSAKIGINLRWIQVGCSLK